MAADAISSIESGLQLVLRAEDITLAEVSKENE
jgi:hypothetical protein